MSNDEIFGAAHTPFDQRKTIDDVIAADRALQRSPAEQARADHIRNVSIELQAARAEYERRDHESRGKSSRAQCMRIAKARLDRAEEAAAALGLA